jgi:uncharacterized protein (DUF924 family)
MTRPEDVLCFWFAGSPADATMAAHARRWFGVDPAFDRTIRGRFGDAIRAAAGGELSAWASSAKGRLALILLADQLPRNAFRGSPEAYALDAYAARLCREGIALAQDRALAPIERIFFYLPLLHAERLSDQECGVAQFHRLRREVTGRDARDVRGWLRLARRHRRIIGRFGRFPHRNAILGRDTTLQERRALCYLRLRERCVRFARRSWSRLRQLVAAGSRSEY